MVSSFSEQCKSICALRVSKTWTERAQNVNGRSNASWQIHLQILRHLQWNLWLLQCVQRHALTPESNTQPKNPKSEIVVTWQVLLSLVSRTEKWGLELKTSKLSKPNFTSRLHANEPRRLALGGPGITNGNTTNGKRFVVLPRTLHYSLLFTTSDFSGVVQRNVGFLLSDDA